jgi:hypothetical protein
MISSFARRTSYTSPSTYYGMKILVNDSSTNDDKYENDIDNDDELIN